jgi:predicted acetyltransferase
MTLKPGYQAVDIPLSRSDEMLEVDGWAFANTPQLATVEELTGVIDFDRARGIEITDPALGEVGTLVACRSSHPYEMRVPGGGSVTTTGLTWVGVHSGHRRRGLLTAMIDEHFARGLARGEVVSTLYAAETEIYQRFGYGLACQSLTLNTGRGLKLRELAGSDDLRLDFENADIERHAAVVRHVLGRIDRPGAHATVGDPLMRDLFIDPELWREGAERLRIAIVHDENGPAAFALFSRKPEWENGEPGGLTTFWTWAAATASAERRLFTVVTDLDLMSKVKARNIAPDDPLVLLVNDVRGAHFAMRDNVWVRVLDIPHALEARAYAADLDLTIAVTDEQLPANSGVWRVRIAGGAAHVARETSAEVLADVSMSVQELGAAYLGGITFSSLANAGLVSGSPESVAALSAAFAWHLKPVSPLSF